MRITMPKDKETTKTPTKKSTAEIQVNIADKKIRRATDFHSIYVNNIQFGFTRFDFQMVFSQVEISRDTEYENTIKETVCATMAAGYAKALLADLTAVLDKYESKYGEILIPPDLK